jgi:hypothetical protein
MAKYKTKELAEYIIKEHLNDLCQHFEGYPKEIKDFDFDNMLMLGNAVWDIEWGTILKISEGNQIKHGYYGNDKLTHEELTELYGDPPTYEHLSWPESNRQMSEEKGAHWTFMNFFESLNVPIVCHIMSLIDKSVVKKTFL